MEYRQLYQQQKSENAILHEEQMQLERSLKTLQVEAQAMKEELSHVQQGSGQGPSSSLQEKILLRKEVESLKCRVIEVEESKRKLLERAKRHQTVYEENQRKSLQELKTLDEMIETVRKTLGSVPDLVAVSQELQALRDYLG
nr:PREDICTED: sperm-associated antigen 5-like [Lepisosteus oculatus]